MARRTGLNEIAAMTSTSTTPSTTNFAIPPPWVRGRRCAGSSWALRVRELLAPRALPEDLPTALAEVLEPLPIAPAARTREEFPDLAGSRAEPGRGGTTLRVDEGGRATAFTAVADPLPTAVAPTSVVASPVGLPKSIAGTLAAAGRLAADALPGAATAGRTAEEALPGAAGAATGLAGTAWAAGLAGVAARGGCSGWVPAVWASLCGRGAAVGAEACRDGALAAASRAEPGREAGVGMP
jgi:hypothetical protein